MKYSLSWLRDSITENRPHEYVYFWGHRPSQDGSVTASCLSQWYPAGFAHEDRYYPTAEHWMMAKKALLFGDDQIHELIFRSKDPKKAKSLGRKVKNFSVSVWREHMIDIVREGSYHKFARNPRLGAWLLNTGSKVLVEASPYDTIWGIGMVKEEAVTVTPAEWRGENWLGWCLMDARDRLR